MGWNFVIKEIYLHTDAFLPGFSTWVNLGELKALKSAGMAFKL